MGKRTKKKMQQPQQGGSRSSSSLSSTTPFSSTTAAAASHQQVDSSNPSESSSSSSSVDIAGSCPHAVNLEKLRTQLVKSTGIFCLDCAKLRSAGSSAGGGGGGGAKERKGRAGSKVTKKKLVVPVSTSSSRGGGGADAAASKQNKVWICLSCGHVGCGLGNPNLISTTEAGGGGGGGGDLSKQEAKQGVVGRGHAWQHWLQLKHPRVMLCGDDFSCWCFVCERAQEVPHDHEAAAATVAATATSSETVQSSLIVETVEKDNNGDNNNNDEAASLPPPPPPPPSRAALLQESEKLVREKLTVQFSAHVKDGDTREPIAGTAAEEEAAAAEGGPHRSPTVENGGQGEKVEGEEDRDRNENENGEGDLSPPASKRRVMKGLTNLGNTCFFNSVMQNLLSLELLRRRFTGPDSSSLPDGALTSSLKKFFLEASASSAPEANGSSEAVGVRRSARTRGGWNSVDGSYNPKCFFGAICQKAPRFKGYQQQDSHELFKALLDGLQTEEEATWKLSKKSKTGGGEDALRALSESEVHENGIRNPAENGDDDHQEYTEAGIREDATEQRQKAKPQDGRKETFVERVFGGKLSTTVTCCECGHSSIKYESFLDLSLPIPSKKPAPSKKGSASGNGTSQSKSSSSQRVQAFKSSSSSGGGRADPDLDVFRSVPAGLGTPLFLLPPPPPPPPKDKSVDRIAPPPNGGYGPGDGGDEAGGGWMDYLDITGGGSSERPDWLAFADEDAIGVGSGEEEVVSGCSPNPEQQQLLAIASGTAAFPDSDSDTKRPAAYVSQSTPAVEQNNGGEYNTSGCEKQGFFMQQSSAETFLLGGGDANGSHSSGVVSHGQMRGGSGTDRREETDSSTPHEPEMEAFRAAAADGEQQQRPISNSRSDIGDSFSVEQFGDCHNDTTEVQSDIIDGPSGTVILLGPPPAADSSGSADGDYDGVGSLFEEEEDNNNNEGGIKYGPLPLTNGDGADLDDSTYDEVIFDDDVLDISKINSDGGKPDWLVLNEEGGGPQGLEGQGDADEDDGVAAMSIEGCLQTYTKSELLTGENAWACDNCTKHYLEKLAVVALAVSSPRLQRGEEASCTSLGSDASFDIPALSINGSDKTNNSTGISIFHGAHDRREVDCNGKPPGNGPGSKKPEASESQENNTCMNCSKSSINGSEVMGMPSDGAKDEPLLNSKREDEPLQEQLLPDSAFRVDNGSSLSVSEKSDIKGAASKSESDGGERSLSGELIGVSESQGGSSTGGSPVSSNPNPEVEANVREVEKKNTRTYSGKPLKLQKSKSRGRVAGAVEAPKRVEIKRDATKRDLISKPPLVLTLQLNRFGQDMRGRLSKLSGHVAFKEHLDLYPFLDRRYVNTEYKYRLIGTVEHSGTLKSGHYVAFVRGPAARGSTNTSSELKSNKDETTATDGGSSSWYYISDEHVHPTKLEAVLRSEAYLLFYERVDVTGAAPPLL